MVFRTRISFPQSFRHGRAFREEGDWGGVKFALTSVQPPPPSLSTIHRLTFVRLMQRGDGFRNLSPARQAKLSQQGFISDRELMPDGKGVRSWAAEMTQDESRLTVAYPCIFSQACASTSART